MPQIRAQYFAESDLLFNSFCVSCHSAAEMKVCLKFKATSQSNEPDRC